MEKKIKATCEDFGSKTLNRVSSINALSVILTRSYDSLRPFNSANVCVGRCVTSQGTARMFLIRPSSFLRSPNACLNTEFSFSRKEARLAIWFSFTRRAYRERVAARLFFLRRAQYLSSCPKKDKRGQVAIKAIRRSGCFRFNN